MRLRTRRSPERGLSIVEALITLALIAIVLLSLIPLFSQSVNVNASSSQLSVANSLAREKLEELLTYPTTDPRLAVTATATSKVYPLDLPTWVKPATGEISTSAQTGVGWFRYPYTGTYTVEPFVTATATTMSAATSTTSNESTFNLPGAVPYYEVKLVTVTVVPSGPFPGLRRTSQSAYVRYRNALPN